MAPLTNNLKICHVNCQSLVAHLDEFRIFFSDNFYHIICMSETWLNDLVDDNYLHLQGYVLVRCDRIGRRGGGVGAYVHNSLQVKSLESSRGTPDKPEFLFLEITSPSVSKLFIGVIYRPPKVGFWNEFEDLINELCPLYKHTIITGDFNTDLHANSYDRQRLLEFLHLNCLHLVPFDPTHHTATSHTLLDLCFVDDMDKVQSSHQRPVPFLSSHDLVSITYKIQVSHEQRDPIWRRNLKKIDNLLLLSDLEALDWNAFFSETSVDDKLRILSDNIIHVFNKHAPLRQMRAGKSLSPWFTDEIKLAIRNRDRLRKKYQRSNLAAHYADFKKARNAVTRIIRDTKRMHYQSQFDSFLTPGALWAKLRQLRLVKVKADNLPPFIDLNLLNRSFIVSNSYDADMNEIAVPDKGFADSFFYFSDISPTVLLDSLRCLRSNAMGLDNISAHMIRITLPVIFPLLLHLYNYSLTYSTFPSSWKSALIRPVPKCKTPSQPGDFRPISLLCALSKPLERIVTNQLSNFLENNHLSDPYQSAYRADHSTQTALIRVTDCIRNAIDQRQLTIMVLFDFSKAFDSVNHSKLIEKLDELGLSTAALSWFASYISNHRQAVMGNGNDLSHWESLTKGVPQGSILGPLLFSIYVNNLRSVIKSSYNFYADDLQIFVHCFPRDIQLALTQLNSDIEQICGWAERNHLTLNAKKTKAIIFGSVRYINNLEHNLLNSLVVQGVTVPFSTQVTLLGVVLTQTLSWREHAVKVVNQANRQLHILRINRNLFPYDLRCKLVSALIMPHIDYCSVVFTNITNEANTLLQRALNNGVRFITGLRRFDHVTPALHSLGWLTVASRRKYFRLCLLYRILNSCKPQYLFSLFNANICNTYDTRSEKILRVPNCRTNTYKHSFTIMAALEWNSVPTKMRDLTNIAAFKSEIFRHLTELDKVTVGP